MSSVGQVERKTQQRVVKLFRDALRRQHAAVVATGRIIPPPPLDPLPRDALVYSMLSRRLPSPLAPLPRRERGTSSGNGLSTISGIFGWRG